MSKLYPGHSEKAQTPRKAQRGDGGNICESELIGHHPRGRGREAEGDTEGEGERGREGLLSLPWGFSSAAKAENHCISGNGSS